VVTKLATLKDSGLNDDTVAALEISLPFIRASSSEGQDSSKFPHAIVLTRDHFRCEDNTLTARLLEAESDSKEAIESAEESENKLLDVQSHLAHLQGALLHFRRVEAACIEEIEKEEASNMFEHRFQTPCRPKHSV